MHLVVKRGIHFLRSRQAEVDLPTYGFWFLCFQHIKESHALYTDKYFSDVSSLINQKGKPLHNAHIMCTVEGPSDVYHFTYATDIFVTYLVI